MSKLDRILEDFVALHEMATEFVGKFLYEPFDIASGPFLNAVTLYVILAGLAFAVRRATRPAPHPRVRHSDNEYDFGRNV